MASLSNPEDTIEMIRKYEFAFQKKSGQNFLVDTYVLEETIDTAGMTKEDMVLEVGPGIGTMAQYLAENAKQMVAVEIDKDPIPILEETLKEYDNVTMLDDDILKVDIGRLAEEYNNDRPIKVVANLPYYITAPIIMGLLESNVPVGNIMVMIQKEVAGRMQVGPGSKDYGAPSLAVQYYVKPYIVTSVPSNYLIPRPNVGLMVTRLTRHQEPPVQMKDSKLIFKLIRASSNQRGKTLRNKLNNSPEISYTKEQAIAAIDSPSMSPTIRGRALILEQLAWPSNYLSGIPQ